MLGCWSFLSVSLFALYTEGVELVGGGVDTVVFVCFVCVVLYIPQVVWKPEITNLLISLHIYYGLRASRAACHPRSPFGSVFWGRAIFWICEAVVPCTKL